VETIGTAAWLGATIWFWLWWFQPEHFTSAIPYTLVTLTLMWVTLAPGYFLLIFRRSRKLPARARPLAGLRVAMVVTKTPSEPFEIVVTTLEAMLAQAYPHDTWLADEDPAPDTIAWAATHGVRISTRLGRTDYHRATWPRRTRCKEGNLAFFYDSHGYTDYEVVAQLDADHVPEPGYLEAMLTPFADPRIGYVSAPSICDRNAAGSWSARGRLFAEASMHGSLQAGYNGGWAPLCIGSHYAVRTSALKEIGGLGPELAEDHSTTLMMNAAGWRGVHALDAIAHGFGPDTFGDLVVQEFQWSRSLMTILLRYTPKLVGGLPPHLRFQFIFAQLWYPLFSLFMTIGFAMPIAALALRFTYANISYVDFLIHAAPLSAILIAMAFNWRASGSFRPHDARVLSWESALFVLVRWPWALLGCLAAVYDRISGSRVDFRVTPKGAVETRDVPLRVLAPYIILAAASAGAALLTTDAGDGNGFYFFAIANAILFALAIVAIVVFHRIENALPWFDNLRHAAIPVAMVLLFAPPALAIESRGLQALEALAWDSPYIQLTESAYRVAGAGLGGGDVRVLRFRFQWLGGVGR
jgi:cellulose synthase/poly-beta-1,6-N-acetylglucosamine synthase-like glycosyltransferase